jgi:hypothetical protein
MGGLAVSGAQWDAGRRAKPAAKSLKGPHCTGHTFAISDPTFGAHFNLEDRLAEVLVVHDRHTELKAPRLSGRSPVLAANSTQS